MPSWPIAGVKLCNIKPEPPDPRALLRSEPDVGPAKLRQRFTAISRFVRGSVYLDGQQRREFETFMAEIRQGAIAFDWPGIDPITDEARSVRIQVVDEEFFAGSTTIPERKTRLDLRVEILP